MNLQEYAKKVEWLCIDFDKEYGHQCVDLIRHYAQNVLKFNLWVFGWSAKTGWFNRSNTFDKKFFNKIIFTKLKMIIRWRRISQSWKERAI